MSIFPLLASVKVTGVVLSVLLVGLFLRGRRVLAGQILAIFFVAELLELAMKFYLPQAPLPKWAARAEDYAPLVTVAHPYPYPSVHVLRSVIVFGSLCLLWKNWFSRASILVMLVCIAASRVTSGCTGHRTS